MKPLRKPLRKPRSKEQGTIKREHRAALQRVMSARASATRYVLVFEIEPKTDLHKDIRRSATGEKKRGRRLLQVFFCREADYKGHLVAP
jgi:nitrate reductase assembly molybdenum cofactor insertion protein NarJ